MTEQDSSSVSMTKKSFVERHQIHPLAFTLACLVVIFVLYQLVAGSITYVLVGSTRVTRENVTALRLLTMGGQILFILIPTLVLGRMLSLKHSTIFPWRIPSLPETVYALMGLLFLQQVFQIYLFFQDMIPLPDVAQKLLSQFKQMIDEMFKGLVGTESLPELFVVLVVVAFVPAVVEEMFFRGLIQRSFERSMDGVRAAVVTGAVFGLYHFNPFAVIPLVGLGCYFGFLRHRSRSIVVPMTAHFLNNALAVLAVFFSMQDEMIVGAEKLGEPNIGAVIIQLILYSTLFGLTFAAYLRTTAQPGEAGHEDV